MANFDIESACHKNNIKMIGVDEAGRGSWAGPLVATACWIDFSNHKLLHSDVNDSKKLKSCLLYTSPSPRDRQKSRMPSSA